MRESPSGTLNKPFYLEAAPRNKGTGHYLLAAVRQQGGGGRLTEETGAVEGRGGPPTPHPRGRPGRGGGGGRSARPAAGSELGSWAASSHLLGLLGPLPGSVCPPVLSLRQGCPEAPPPSDLHLFIQASREPNGSAPALTELKSNGGHRGTNR